MPVVNESPESRVEGLDDDGMYLLLMHQRVGAGHPHGFLQEALTELAAIQEGLGEQAAARQDQGKFGELGTAMEAGGGASATAGATLCSCVKEGRHCERMHTPASKWERVPLICSGFSGTGRHRRVTMSRFSSLLGGKAPQHGQRRSVRVARGTCGVGRETRSKPEMPSTGSGRWTLLFQLCATSAQLPRHQHERSGTARQCMR
mmetsp:Transcript_18188/g.36745  ORF Transcript_18188/g.36745 Transcript_18188/m.36745 type:complete len:204 (-) Transcript_18188:3352-3963(-)